VLEREVLQAADLFRLEALLEHCVEAFRRGLKVDTVIEELVWAHLFGPAEARKVATEYFVRNGLRIQVGTICDCALCLMCVGGLGLACSTKKQAAMCYFEGHGGHGKDCGVCWVLSGFFLL
jgi:ubiquitin